MLGMSQHTFLLLDAVVTIIGLIVLITRFKLHPFIALIIASAFLGLTAGMPANLIIKFVSSIESAGTNTSGAWRNSGKTNIKKSSWGCINHVINLSMY